MWQLIITCVNIGSTLNVRVLHSGVVPFATVYHLKPILTSPWYNAVHPAGVLYTLPFCTSYFHRNCVPSISSTHYFQSPGVVWPTVYCASWYSIHFTARVALSPGCVMMYGVYHPGWRRRPSLSSCPSPGAIIQTPGGNMLIGMYFIN